jgi:hypothetical protein
MPPAYAGYKCIGGERWCSKPIYGLGLGVSPALKISGSLSGLIDGPGVHRTFVINESSTDLDFIIPTSELSRIVEPVPVVIHNIKYTWTASINFRFFVWGFVINPKALLDKNFDAPRGEKQWFTKTIDIGNFTLNLPTQTYNDPEGFTIYIPASLMDKDPFQLDSLKVLLIAVTIGSVISAKLARRGRH